MTFTHTEPEYLAAIRFYVVRSRELMARFIICSVLIAVALLMLSLLVDAGLPIWSLLILVVLGGFGMFHGFTIDVPRRYFRGNPKFRDEYHLTFSNDGIQFKTQNMSSSMAWDFYTGVIENNSFYLLIYGNNIHQLSLVPKRAFRSAQQETAFRALLRRHLDKNLALSDGEREPSEYVPARLEPPDWR